MHDVMKDALKKKRAKGLDISIVINGEDHSPQTGAMPVGQGMLPDGTEPDEAKVAKELDLAPPGAKDAHPDEAQDMQMIKEMVGSHGKGGLNSKIAAHYDKKAKK